MSGYRSEGWRRRLLSSARVRILAAYVVLLLVSTLVGFVALRQILIARADERVDNDLVQETEEFRRLARDGRDPRTGKPFGIDIEAIFDVYLSRNVPDEGEAVFTFVDGRAHRANFYSRPGGETVAFIRGLGAIRGTRSGEVGRGEGRARYLAVPVRTGGRSRGVFAVTINLGSELSQTGHALRVATGASIAVLVLALVLAWVIAGRVLAPLRLLADTARSIGESDLTRRIAVEGHDEIVELARTFNSMLDRLETAFASQKAFISDAGHELRTPITIIRGHLELLGDDPEERRETVELVTDELDRMSRFVDDLLLLAKAKRPDFLHLESLDLDATMRELFAKTQALGPRDWRLERVAAARVRADRQRLTQAVMNLGQNAVQQTGEGDAVALGADLDDGYARIWVRDTGPGVPEADRERIFERFARSSNGTVSPDGAGLGLAIVRVIAEAHGGSVELDSEPGAGATFTVVIPAERVPEGTSA